MTTYSAVRMLGGSLAASGRRGMLSTHMGTSVRTLSSSGPAEPPADKPVVPPVGDDVPSKKTTTKNTSSFVLDLQANALARANAVNATGIPVGPVASNFTSKRGAKPIELKKPFFSAKHEDKPAAHAATSFASKRSSKPAAAEKVEKPVAMLASRRGPPLASRRSAKPAATKDEEEPVAMASKRTAKPALAKNEEKPVAMASKRIAKATVAKEEEQPVTMVSKRTAKPAVGKEEPKPIAMASKRIAKPDVAKEEAKPIAMASKRIPKPSFTSKRVSKLDASSDLGNTSTSTPNTEVPSELGNASTGTAETVVPTELGNESSSSASSKPAPRLATRRLAAPPQSERSDNIDRSSRTEETSASTRKPAVKFTARRMPVGVIGSSLPERAAKRPVATQIEEEDDPNDPRTKAKQWASRRLAKEKVQAAAGEVGDQSIAVKGKGKGGAVARTETRRVPQTSGGGGGGRGGGRGGGGGRGRGGKAESYEERINEQALRYVLGTGNQAMPVQMLLPPMQLRQDLYNKHQLDPVAHSFTRLAQAYRMRPAKVAGIVRMVGLEKDHEAETGVLDFTVEHKVREMWGESWVQYTESREEDMIRRHSKINYTTFSDEEQTPDERIAARIKRDAERKVKWIKKEVQLAKDIARDAATSKGLSAAEIQEAGEAAAAARTAEIKMAEQAKEERVKSSRIDLGARPDVGDTPWGGPTDDKEITALDAELYKRFWRPIEPPTHVIKEVGKYVYRDVSLVKPQEKHSKMRNQGVVNQNELRKKARS